MGTSNTWEFDSELTNGTARFTQQITFSFSSEVTDRVGALATIDLAETNFVLEQKFDNPAA
ncbi:hypothetical protein G7066_09040 [Leucobacter coleopterorum]|uniref:Uncharacterized protein n=1 Tax=Leucobacter coleopterorum TaxID=2714933 RepID=A0ABX6JWN4_9MICO|nr:hypothetical protein [Leucobacter coleopterorum]QIM18716.1 hypothetical protein G7066_09040 [Leucobacter coleopterorum]